ncbi:MAG: homocitrate synthase [Desulfobacterales bacterium]|nr:homocitrate synthase [Desulfobacterales bacterium]
MDDLNERTLKIIDTTLRDGEQTPYVSFNRENKIQIAEMLEEAGVDEIEAGIPVMGSIEQKTISDITKRIKNSQIISWCRASRLDLECAEKCNTGRVHISFPVSEIQLDLMGKDHKWLFDIAEDIISEAVKRFDFVSVGALDATRCEINILKDFSKFTLLLGAKRLRIADTVGIGTPLNIYNIFKELLENESGLKYEFHGHNDLAMAVANSISAFEAGADAISTTINGIGERAGNAATEEVIAALKYGSLKKTNINLKNLIAVCKLIEKLSGIKTNKLKPVTGKNINVHESGIHCNGMLKNPLSFQPFNPEEFGLEQAIFVAGKHSGLNGLKHILEKKGIIPSENYVRKLIKKIKFDLESNSGFKVEELVDMDKIYEEIELS